MYGTHTRFSLGDLGGRPGERDVSVKNDVPLKILKLQRGEREIGSPPVRPRRAGFSVFEVSGGQGKCYFCSYLS